VKKLFAIALFTSFLFMNIKASERKHVGYYMFLGAPIDIYETTKEKEVDLGPKGSVQMGGTYEGPGSLHEQMKPEGGYQTEMEKLRKIALKNRKNRKK